MVKIANVSVRCLFFYYISHKLNIAVDKIVQVYMCVCVYIYILYIITFILSDSCCMIMLCIQKHKQRGQANKTFKNVFIVL